MMKRQLPEQSQQEPQQHLATTSHHALGAVRHAEKRRTGTCRFADRIGTISLDCFRKRIPASFRETQKQTCVAAIVAHFTSDGHLQVQSLGVGTKFLPESILQQELGKEQRTEVLVGMDGHSYLQGYGIRVRDCHAEVLARRAFRRQLYVDMQQSPQGRCILEKCNDGQFRLKSDVTLHMYTSSAPCGNATIKKFATMKKEIFDPRLGPNEWPSEEHQAIQPHSLKLGQFALLLKKDRNVTEIIKRKPLQPGKMWPSNESDDWCPPGTTIVWSNQGSIHTCSDKICRWNYLGLQGSLLTSLLESPVYMASLTVGRKFTSCICQRAVCCRAVEKAKSRKEQVPTTDTEESTTYSLHHPAVMGTGMYMDDSGVLGMSDESEFGQEVRFYSPLCYAWWPSMDGDEECIDGSTGLAVKGNDEPHVSRLSTMSLMRLHCTLSGEMESATVPTLESVRSFKNQVSPDYEGAKASLLTKNKMFRGWRRRGSLTKNDSNDL